VLAADKHMPPKAKASKKFYNFFRAVEKAFQKIDVSEVDQQISIEGTRHVVYSLTTFCLYTNYSLV